MTAAWWEHLAELLDEAAEYLVSTMRARPPTTWRARPGWRVQ